MHLMKYFTLLYSNKQIAVGTSLVLALAFMAIFAPCLSPYRYSKQDYDAILEPPSSSHFFGTDDLGRDTFSRVIYGGQASLLSALGAASVAGIIGITVGLFAGYFGGYLDRLIQALVDVTWSFPTLLLALVLVVVMKPGLITTLFAIGVSYWPQYTQVLRSEVLVLREEEYILAAHAIGATNRRILWKHVLPNVIPPVIVLVSLSMGNAIIVESSLSFLGLGVQPPLASWGTLLSDGRDFLSVAPWLTLFPGLAIMLAVLGFNLLGDGLRDILDPYLRHTRK